MAYVSSDAPLPPNSMDPPSACQTKVGSSILQSVETAVSNARAASAQVAAPGSFAPLGQGVVNDVARSQSQLKVSGSLVPLKNAGGSSIPAPTILPLNVTTQEYGGCSMRGTGPLQPIPISAHQQGVQMPPPAPTDTMALVYPNVVQVAAPAPSVQSVVIPGSGIPGAAPAPVRPMQYWGLAGARRGMGMAWGDARGVKAPGANGSAVPINWGMLALFGIGAVGLVAGLRKRR